MSKNEFAHPVNSDPRHLLPKIEMRLHSYETYLYKYLLPIVWIPWDRFRSFRRAFPSAEPTMIGLGIILWCLIYLLLIWYAIRLKTVATTGSGLRIGGYFGEVEVPLSNVANVKHNWFMKNDTLQLTVPSEFGDKILFIARGRISTEGGRRSTLDVMRGLINKRDLLRRFRNNSLDWSGGSVAAKRKVVSAKGT